MGLRAIIKKNARRALSRHWSRAAAIALVMLIFSLVFVTLESLAATLLGLPDLLEPINRSLLLQNALPEGSGGLSLLVLGVCALLWVGVMAPLRLGMVRWFVQLADGHAGQTAELFLFLSSPKRVLRATGLHLMVLFGSLLWSALFLAAPCGMIWFGGRSAAVAQTDGQAVLANGIVALGWAVLAVVCVLLLVWLMRYYLASLLMAHNPALTVRKALRRSVRLSEGRRGFMLRLELSMLGWRFADLLLLPRMFTEPYRCTARGIYLNYLLELTRREYAEQKAAQEEQKVQEAQQEQEFQEDQEPQAEQDVQAEQETNTRQAAIEEVRGAAAPDAEAGESDRRDSESSSGSKPSPAGDRAAQPPSDDDTAPDDSRPNPLDDNDDGRRPEAPPCDEGQA